LHDGIEWLLDRIDLINQSEFQPSHFIQATNTPAMAIAGKPNSNCQNKRDKWLARQ
jgi:hypothetical protein